MNVFHFENLESNSDIPISKHYFTIYTIYSQEQVYYLDSLTQLNNFGNDSTNIRSVKI